MAHKQIRTQLRDCLAHGAPTREVVIDITETMVEISVEGYGAADSAPFGQENRPGEAAIAALELCQGHLRFLIWPDINEPDPDVYSLRHAAEELREVGE